MDMAVLYDDSAAADLLRQHGAEYGPREAAAFNNLQDVQRKVAEDPEILRMKYAAIPGPAGTAQGLTLLGISLQHGHRDLALQLIAAGAPLDSIESDESSLLHVAARGGNPHLVKLLIDRGLGVNAANKIYMTPLHIAAAWNRGEAAEALIAGGADLDGALYWAVVRGNLETTRVLLAAGQVGTAGVSRPAGTCCKAQAVATGPVRPPTKRLSTGYTRFARQAVAAAGTSLSRFSTAWRATELYPLSHAKQWHIRPGDILWSYLDSATLLHASGVKACDTLQLE
jgi:hypothetical protein